MMARHWPLTELTARRFSGSKVRAHCGPSLHSNGLPSRSLRKAPSLKPPMRESSFVAIASAFASASGAGLLSRIASATSKPRPCTRLLPTSCNEPSTAPRCARVKCTRSSSRASCGARRVSWPLTFRKQAPTASRTSTASCGSRRRRPRRIRFSAATACTSGISKRLRAGHASPAAWSQARAERQSRLSLCASPAGALMEAWRPRPARPQLPRIRRTPATAATFARARRWRKSRSLDFMDWMVGGSGSSGPSLKGVSSVTLASSGSEGQLPDGQTTALPLLAALPAHRAMGQAPGAGAEGLTEGRAAGGA
mmetsp:Transcript_120749/g.375293  ORF Transcript_120749/g.375293 Transcript_120749/m.375293 type:complete len:310 (+) Transcript_120749:95-1024(+)